MHKTFPLLILSLLTLSSCVQTNSTSDLSSEDDIVSSTDSENSSPTSNEGPGEPPEGEYRISPSPSESDIGFVYNEYGLVMKEIYRDSYYTDLEDVAAYIVTFNDVPDNYYFTTERDGYYESKSLCYGLYGNACRIYPGPYEGNYTHLPYSLDNIYNEADYGGDGYAESSSWNRGAYRLVFTLTGISDYGNDTPVVFYTHDHYDTFIEYKNYYGGWGQAFGDNGISWSSISTWF